MKWTNKGHEIEKADIFFSDSFFEKIYIFGAGKIGRDVGKCLEVFGLLGGYIDNNIERQGTNYLGKTVLSLDDYLAFESEPAIVVACSKKNMLDIEHQLEEKFLLHKKDYFLYDEFDNKILPMITTLYLNKVYMPLTQITLTERCSLKCKKCAHACYNVDNKADDMGILEVYKSADSFFSKVDYVKEFVLIGGEPILYKELAKAIIYIGENYRNQIGTYCITTNGTIIPSEDVLLACHKYHVFFRISNYSEAIPRLRKSYQELAHVLEKYEIEYRLYPEEGTWIDYGFEYLNKDMDEDLLIETFDKCMTPCREVRGSKLYFCVMARSVSDNLHLGEGCDDYLDLDKLDTEDYKRELMEFNLGYSDKGYLDMCHRCHGMDAQNYPIPIAEQLDSKQYINRKMKSTK